MRSAAPLLLLCSTATAQDPAGGWMAYAVGAMPSGKERITRLEMKWKVSKDPPRSGSFYSPWFGMDPSDNLNLIQPVNPWGGSSWSAYTEYFQWSPENNKNSKQISVKAGQTLHGSLVYEDATDSYNLHQTNLDTGATSKQNVKCQSGKKYTVPYVVYEKLTSCRNYPPDGVVNFYDIKAECDGEDCTSAIKWEAKVKDKNCDMKAHIISPTNISITWDTSAESQYDSYTDAELFDLNFHGWAARLPLRRPEGGADAADLRRARSPKPGAGSAVASDSGAGVFRAIDAHLRRDGVQTRACEEWHHDELDAVVARLSASRDARLQSLYEARVDKRALSAAAAAAPQTNETRDGACAHAVMLWAHHVPAPARRALRSAGVALPRMPAAGPRADGGRLYREQVSCVSCHYIGGKVERPAAAAVAAAGDPPLPMWGGAPQFYVEVNMTDISDSPSCPNWRFKYYYDSTLKADRYEHPEGQCDEVCKGVAKNKEACTVINAAGGKAQYKQTPAKCCGSSGGLFPGSGGVAVRSDWISDQGSSYQGQSTIRNIKVDEWLKQGASDNHYYVTADAKQLPVRYMEHKNGKIKQWDFDLGTYAAGAQPSSLFQQPSGCTKSC